jgi:hypothetical protein
MDPGQEYIKLYQRMANLCKQQGWGDPFSYARSKEIYAAIELGHEVASTFSGADAFNEFGYPVEYKSTTGKKAKGSYTGISVQKTWDEQVEYLLKDKIAKYPEHFYNRFEDGKLVECWKLSGTKVLELLLPKLQEKYPTVLTKKDPRLSASISNAMLQKNAKKVI